MAIDPRYLEIERWSALTASSLAQYGYVANSTNEQEWRAWAERVRHLPALSAFSVPDPKFYADWRAWAYRLNEALLSLGIV
jgi:hypothetical protein